MFVTYLKVDNIDEAISELKSKENGPSWFQKFAPVFAFNWIDKTIQETCGNIPIYEGPDIKDYITTRLVKLDSLR